MTLTTKTKQALKGRAHKLKPVVLIGNNGMSETVVAEIDRALTDHELIKIRMAGNDRLARRAAYESACNSLNAELVQTIGSIAVLYRKSNKNQ